MDLRHPVALLALVVLSSNTSLHISSNTPIPSHKRSSPPPHLTTENSSVGCVRRHCSWAPWQGSCLKVSRDKSRQDKALVSKSRETSLDKTRLLSQAPWWFLVRPQPEIGYLAPPSDSVPRSPFRSSPSVLSLRCSLLASLCHDDAGRVVRVSHGGGFDSKETVSLDSK